MNNPNLPLPRLCIALLAAIVAAIRGLSPRRRAASPPMVGLYVLGARIGQGGMGDVYRARHVMLDRDVAIKRLSSDHDDEGARRAFAREVRLTSRLRSHSTIAVHDCGYDDQGRPYYAMDLAEGSDLELLVRRQGPLPAGRVLRMLQQICDALDEVHGLGIVHRDLKPANVVLEGETGDHVKLLDFGLAVEIAAPRELAFALLGTPAYLAPESILAPATVDARTDLYGVGAIGYWLLTGTDVFAGSSVVELCSHHVHAAPEGLSQRLGAEVPADLEAVILRCLAKDPAQRFASARALREALEACASRAAVVVGNRRVDRGDAGAAGSAARGADGVAQHGAADRTALNRWLALHDGRRHRGRGAGTADAAGGAVVGITAAAGERGACPRRLARGRVGFVATRDVGAGLHARGLDLPDARHLGRAAGDRSSAILASIAPAPVGMAAIHAALHRRVAVRVELRRAAVEG